MPDIPSPAQPWIDPAQRIMDLEAQVDTLARQLAEIDAVTAPCFPADTPLPSRIADLVADWHDTTVICGFDTEDTLPGPGVTQRIDNQIQRRGWM